MLEPFGFDENLVAFLVREPGHLVFDGRAVARSPVPLMTPVNKGDLSKPDRMAWWVGLVGVGEPAGQLAQGYARRAEAERRGRIVPWLDDHF